MEALAFTLTYAIPAAFAATGAAIVGAAAMNAAGRNPEKINDLRTMMVQTAAVCSLPKRAISPENSVKFS